MANLIPLFRQTHTTEKPHTNNGGNIEKHHPDTCIIAQTHTGLIDLHHRVRDQSQPPIQYEL